MVRMGSMLSFLRTRIQGTDQKMPRKSTWKWLEIFLQWTPQGLWVMFPTWLHWREIVISQCEALKLIGFSDLRGEWDQWSEWSPCSATCGLAKRQRQRDCKGVDCVGEDTEIQSCTDLPQCQWDNWSEWSECSTTCGVGRKTRFRLCNDGRNCIGDSLQYESCPTNPTCPQPTEGEWMTWSMWSTCSSTCGDGIKQRVRHCKNKMECNGSRVERQPCQEPVNLHDHPECNELWNRGFS